MKTSLCALAVCLLTLAAPRAAVAQTGPPTGRILLLKNGRTLEGEITRDGNQYVIRRPVGEITLPADRVQTLCADWDEAFAFVRGQANLRDPDERLRLARWCQQHGLNKQAVAEAAAAVRLRPGHAESRRLLKLLQRVEQSATAPPSAAVPKAEVTPLPAIDLDAEALSLFTTRVQPVLMNACASCHCSGRGGSFQLLRVSSSTATNRSATQHNLAAVLRRVDLERPAMSKLLIKALSDHAGTGQAPIKKRDSAAFRNLERWLNAAIASNPHLRELPELRHPQTAVAAPPVPVPMTVAPIERTGFATTAPAKGTDLPPAPLPAVKEGARPVPTIASLTPLQPARPLTGAAATPAERDEYDPAEFNRRAQPPRNEK